MAGSSWWKEVSGPGRFIGSVAESAMAQKSVILSVPAELPFEDQFFSRLTEELQAGFSGHQVALLNGITGSPAQYFLNKCCKPEVRTTFRPKPNYSAANFLADTKSATLHGACYIVDPGDASEIPEWIDFISASSYGSATSTSGVVKINFDPNINMYNSHVLVIEDIVDSGITLKYVMDNRRCYTDIYSIIRHDRPTL